MTRTYLRFGLTQLGIYVIMFGLTQWVEAARGLSAYEAGLMLIPMGVADVTTATLPPRGKSVSASRTRAMSPASQCQRS